MKENRDFLMDSNAVYYLNASRRNDALEMLRKFNQCRKDIMKWLFKHCKANVGVITSHWAGCGAHSQALISHPACSIWSFDPL